MNNLPSLWPGIVVSYDREKRSARVSIPGVTDGTDTLPEAVFSNPLGDRADITEIRIDPGDPVWLMFEGGDPRFPIITGYRTPRAGNPIDWRRWRHANIEMSADGIIRLNASTVEINADSVTVTAQEFDLTSAQVSVESVTTTVDGAVQFGGPVQFAGAVQFDADSLVHQGTNVGKTHTHSGVEQGIHSTGVPI